MSRDIPSELGRLPLLEPAQDGWPAIAAALNRRAGAQRYGQWWLAAAAALLAIVLTPALLRTPSPAAISGMPRELAQWVDYSQELERELRSLRADSTTYRGQHAAILSELERRVAAVDWQLELPLSVAEQRELWQQRTTLMHDLVTVETANRLAINLDRSGEPGAPLRPVQTINRPRAVPASYQL